MYFMNIANQKGNYIRVLCDFDVNSCMWCHFGMSVLKKKYITEVLDCCTEVINPTQLVACRIYYPDCLSDKPACTCV